MHTNYHGKKLIYPEERANRRIYFVVSTPFSLLEPRLGANTNEPLSLPLSLSRSIREA